MIDEIKKDLATLLTDWTDENGWWDGFEQVAANGFGVEILYLSDFTATVAFRGFTFNLHHDEYDAQGFLWVNEEVGR